MDSKTAQIEQILGLLETTFVQNQSLAQILRRPDATWKSVINGFPQLQEVPDPIARQVACDIKYAGYLAREDAERERQAHLSKRRIPVGFDYSTVRHLRIEARERLARVEPSDLAQAGRISGITPADLAVLLIHLDGRK